jgi:hypothetical protein
MNGDLLEADFWPTSLRVPSSITSCLPVTRPQLATPAITAELEQKFNKRLDEIQAKYSGPNPPAPNTFAAQAIFRYEENMSDADGISDWIHFDRHKIPLKRDLDRRRNKDWGSTNRVLRTVTDLEQLRCGKPIRPFRSHQAHCAPGPLQVLV